MRQIGKRVIVSVGLPRDAALRLQALAQRRERTMSWLSARFIVRELEREEATEQQTA